MVAEALRRDWKLVGGDWAGWDLQHRTRGARIEVKQAAARQTWTGRPTASGKLGPSKGVFSVRPAKGYFTEGGVAWVPIPGRSADLYIFAWHPVADSLRVDHRDPEQWEFYVVPEHRLPAETRTITLRRLQRLARPVGYAELPGAVDAALAGLERLKIDIQVP
ncbi:MAG: hypothetical protein D6781_14745 [Verrucomicrobia bacterium]|nr:MAG: hypothetical protein D6781_14745 [Verrucomicrobiota bacterium]